MAESDKGTASSSKAKEKISALDDDISKNLFGSWNTSIGAESDDSSMDFKFEPLKGKKKEFDFDKLDMDFSLDGEFDKIKSFKLDMGDLDFSSSPKTSTKSKGTDLDFSPPMTSAKPKGTDLDFSPPKTSTKSKETDLDFSSPPKEGTNFKERLEGKSAKSNKGNQDCFAFSFDFNELDKFDLDAALPTRTKELNKDDAKKGVKINSTDKHEDQGSKIQLADTDARDAGDLKAKAMQVKAKNSKENLIACGGDLDMLPEIDPSNSSTLQDQIESKQSKTSSGREKTHQRSPVVKKTCNESYEESQLQNQFAQNVQDQTRSKPVPIVSEGAITDNAQRIDKQSDQVASFFKNSYEKPKVQNQPAWSFTDKISAFNVSEQMQTTSAGGKSGDADSKMQDLNPKVDPLTLENEYFPVKKMMPQDECKHLQNIPEVESEGTDGENNVPKSCNVLHGDMDTATVAENVLHAKGSPVVDASKLGAHLAESISGRQKTPTEIASSRVSRFNLKPVTKDKTPASTQVLPRSNLVSLNRNAISSLQPSPSGARHSAHTAQSRSKFDKNSGSFHQEAVGECFVSENNTKIISDQSAREHCNAMVTQMKNNLGAISVPNDGKATDRGTAFLENEKKKEDTKSSSSPALEDKNIVIAKNLDGNGMNVTTKTVQLVGSGKPQPPTPSYKAQSLAPSIKRKIAEVSDAAPIMSHPSKRFSASQRRNSKEDSEGVAQEEVGFHKNILNCSLKSATDKQPESTFEMPREMKFADVGVTLVMENDETIEKAEACGKELDQICIMLKKKQEEAKELLVRALVTSNKLLLLSNPTHALKLCQARNLASRLMSKELPSRCVDPAM